MPRKQRLAWEPGAVFAVPLADGTLALGQAIALMWPNVVYCALTTRRTERAQTAVTAISRSDTIALVALTREQLDYGAWPVLGYAQLVASKAEFANERFAAAGYVGAKVYDAALAEDFLNAAHALAPWDDWHDAGYLDTWLISPAHKPRVLRFKSDAPAS